MCLYVIHSRISNRLSACVLVCAFVCFVTFIYIYIYICKHIHIYVYIKAQKYVKSILLNENPLKGLAVQIEVNQVF